MKSIKSSSSSASPFQMCSRRNAHTRKCPCMCPNGLHKSSALLLTSQRPFSCLQTVRNTRLSHCRIHNSKVEHEERIHTLPLTKLSASLHRKQYLSVYARSHTTFQFTAQSQTSSSCPAHPLASTALPRSLLLSHPLSLPASSFHGLLVVVSSFSCFDITSVSSLIKRICQTRGCLCLKCMFWAPLSTPLCQEMPTGHVCGYQLHLCVFSAAESDLPKEEFRIQPSGKGSHVTTKD